jgi:hypothetical protein
MELIPVYRTTVDELPFMFLPGMLAAVPPYLICFSITDLLLMQETMKAGHHSMKLYTMGVWNAWKNWLDTVLM